MSDPFRSWRATFTRRWHANYDLMDTHDLVGGHSARVALLALHLKPDLSRDALLNALVHDLGEMSVGDHAYDFKKAYPDIAQQAAVLEVKEVREQQGLPFPEIYAAEHRLIKLCDWLDAYLWMLRHAPHLRHRTDWAAQMCALLKEADDLRLGDEVRGIVDAAVEYRKGVT